MILTSEDPIQLAAAACSLAATVLALATADGEVQRAHPRAPDTRRCHAVAAPPCETMDLLTRTVADAKDRGALGAKIRGAEAPASQSTAGRAPRSEVRRLRPAPLRTASCHLRLLQINPPFAARPLRADGAQP
jgi:hypothetical protein